MTKEQLRKIYKQKRLAITEKEQVKLDDLLLIQFQQLPLDDVLLLFSYLPIAEKAEPQTELFIQYLYFRIPGLQVAYPVSDLTGNSMQAILVHDDTVYHTNRLGITEPTEGEVADPELIDLVFVPLLVADRQGNRVGYGKGFYDRYLKQCREDAVKIGFSYFDPVDKIDDTQPFDVPLNYCITPERIYEF